MNTDDVETPLLSADKLSKSFGHVVALVDSGIELRAGEVLAVVGDNGAGKSTLIKCLTAALIPDTGTLHIGGEMTRAENWPPARSATSTSSAMDRCSRTTTGLKRPAPHSIRALEMNPHWATLAASTRTDTSSSPTGWRS